MSYRDRAQYRHNYRGRSQYDQNYRSNFRRGNIREMQNYRGEHFRGGYRGSYRNENFGRGRSMSRDKDSIQVILGEMIKAVVEQDQIWEQVLLEIGLEVLDEGRMIILLKNVWMRQRKNR